MKTLLLIDANALVHRAFHALPPLTAPDGRPIGAIYGLASTLLKVLREQPPDYVAACFDRPEPTFREVMFKDYKAHRPAAAEELISQIIEAHQLFEKFKITVFEKAGYEADDIIGTAVNAFKEESDLKITILTGDLDTLQLILNDRIVVQTFKKGVSDITIYNEQAVIDRYGLKPSQLADYKGLVGDASDNIPGVKGVGPKTAEKILKEYGSLENFFRQLEKEKNNPLTKKFLPAKEDALFSKKLATIEPAVPLEGLNLANLTYPGLPQAEIVQYFTILGFQSLIDRLLREPSRLASSQKKKIVYDWHDLLEKSGQPGEISPKEFFDLKIAGWLVDPDQEDFSLPALARRFLHQGTASPEELFVFLDRKIDDYGLRFIFEKIEMPLVPVLVAMEKNGIKINNSKLENLDGQARQELEILAKKIYKNAGGPFNVNSPKQLADVLFQKLKIQPPKIRKTETGRPSTAEPILQEIKNEHPIIPLILEYRETFKIKSTYLEPLAVMTAGDGRLHTHFIQTGTATGRLSSEKPNLQNIPQSSKWAQPIRDVFEAEKNWQFLGLDYSQIQLRILAHETDDPKLKEAFLKGQDIHQLTAAQVFNVPLDKVTPEMRRVAKTLNFGIIYGMGAAAFSRESGLSRTEADAFIKEYFNDFPSIRQWQEKIKAEARTFGFVKNLNGRRRWFLQILSGHPRAQAEAERAAVNMPIQSLEADIVKMAMVKTAQTIKERGWSEKIKPILSIHDELLFEVRNDILNQAAPVLKETMEKIQTLAVPLKVDVKSGPTWGSLKSFSKI